MRLRVVSWRRRIEPGVWLWVRPASREGAMTNAERAA